MSINWETAPLNNPETEPGLIDRLIALVDKVFRKAIKERL